MDQPGPRHTALKSPIIERSDLQKPHQRTLYAVLTVAFWAFWVYLWLPLLALLAWALGVQQAYQYMVGLGGYHELVRLLGDYALTILIFDGILLLWAGYNIYRFRGIERRAAALPVTAAQMSQHFGGGDEALARWQTEPMLYVSHDQHGHVLRVDTVPLV